MVGDPLAAGLAPYFWLQPAATVLAAVLALLGAGLLVRQGRATLAQRDAADRAGLDQKDAADRKDAWWQRTQWAVDLTLSEHPTVREFGYRMVDQQADSSLADTEDLALIDAVYDTDLDEVLDNDVEEGDHGAADGEGDGHG